MRGEPNPTSKFLPRNVAYDMPRFLEAYTVYASSDQLASTDVVIYSDTLCGPRADPLMTDYCYSAVQ